MAVKESIVPLAVPPQSADGQWELFPMAWVRAYAAQVMKEKPNPATIALETMFCRISPGQRRGFQQGRAANISAQLAADPPADADLAKVRYEAWFDHFEPFYLGLILDLTAFLLVVLAWFGRQPAAQPHRLLGAGADLRGPHAGTGVADLHLGPAAGDESVFGGGLHRLGGNAVRPGAGADLSAGHRQPDRQRGRLCHAVDRPFSGRRRRHA